MDRNELQKQLSDLRGQVILVDRDTISPEFYRQAEAEGFIVEGRLDWDKLITSMSSDQMKAVVKQLGVKM